MAGLSDRYWVVARDLVGTCSGPVRDLLGAGAGSAPSCHRPAGRPVASHDPWSQTVMDAGVCRHIS